MIVALHGNLGQPSDWEAIETLTGLPFDKRNLWAPGALNFAEEDVLIGYSLGGRLALQAAVAEPEKFAAIIVISTHPGLATETERQARLAMDQHWATRLRTLPWAEFLTLWDAQEIFQGPLPPSASRPACPATGFAEWSLGNQADLRAGLQAVRAPIVWITGADDPKFTALAASAGVGQHHVIPHAGHRVLADQPRALAALLRELLIALPDGLGA